ncbi:MAG: DNA polymerase III subunit alpha [Planctomycetes bacterium]|nr:DNA polymerase III subunit alpha [Planctomycetota bacterium]
MVISDFVHLHVHSGYSLLDGQTTPENLAAKAKEHGMSALALTDHGNLFGAIEFYDACKKEGIKPIIGMEGYVTRVSRHTRTREEPNFHLCLLAKNHAGYQNLMKLSSEAYLTGFYYKPRLDFDLLAEHSEGLIALTACLGGMVPHYLLRDQYSEARETAIRMREIFGQDHLFLELQRHGIKEQVHVNEGLMKLSKALDIPLVATNDVHYLNEEDQEPHDALICINTGCLVCEQNRMRYEGLYHLRSIDEMHRLFSDVEDALANTVAISKMCDLELNFKGYKIPKFSAPEGHTESSYLRHLCEEGFQGRYKSTDQIARERLEFELGVIEKMQFPGYFLIVWDFIRYAREHDIPVGPGRGSAAGSVVAYCLGITDLDPIRYDLLFERFLNPERISMPDIDIDFCKDGREEVMRYVKGKYGENNVSQIITFGTLGSKTVIRDVARVKGVELKKADFIAKMIPTKGTVAASLSDAEEKEPEFKKLQETDAEAREIIAIGKRLEGLPRNVSTHAAGVVISDRPLTEYVPLFKAEATDGAISTQWDMTVVEKIGLLKMDFLGLRNLTVIAKAEKSIRKRHGIQLDIRKLDWHADTPENRKAYKLLASGHTIGIFQVESSGMRELLVRMKPDRFEDIAAVLAIYRPGPLGANMHNDYVERKHGRQEVTYLDPRLADILGETYGGIIYQEQVMLIAHKLAGFSMAEADGLRKAMGKKIKAKMDEYQPKFMTGALARGMRQDVAEKLWEQMAFFAEYGFNKSHTAAYAVISYQTAWLKANYAVEYMAAYLSCVIGFQDKVVELIDECRRMGIRVLPPDINESGRDFTPVGDAIRFGLEAVKGAGEKAIASIVSARENLGHFKDIHDVSEKVDLKTCNAKVFEVLIKAGAFDSIHEKRAPLLKELPNALKSGQTTQKSKAAGQKSIFELLGESHESADEAQAPATIDGVEWTDKEKFAYEKEVLGFYISGSPLNTHEEVIRKFSTVRVSEVLERQFTDGYRVIVGGIINYMKTRVANSGRNAGKKFAILSVEDLSGVIEVAVYSEVYETCKEFIADDAVVMIDGTIDCTREQKKINASKVIPIADAAEHLTGVVQISIPVEKATDSTLIKLRQAFEKFPGASSVRLKLISEDGGYACLRANPGKFGVSFSDKFIARVAGIVEGGAIETARMNIDQPEARRPRYRFQGAGK